MVHDHYNNGLKLGDCILSDGTIVLTLTGPTAVPTYSDVIRTSIMIFLG